MMRLAGSFSFFLVMIITVGCSTAHVRAAGPPPTPITAPELEKDALAFTTDLAAHRFESAKAHFDEAMKTALPAPKLAKLWASLEKENGSFVRLDSTDAVEQAHHRVARVRAQFERTRRMLRVVYDRQNRVSGLWLHPIQEDLQGRVRAFLVALDERRFAAAEGDLDDPTRNALHAGGLETLWTTLIGRMGPFRAIDSMVVKELDYGDWSVTANCRFEGGATGIRVVFTHGDRIAGLWIVRPEAPTAGAGVER